VALLIAASPLIAAVSLFAEQTCRPARLHTKLDVNTLPANAIRKIFQLVKLNRHGPASRSAKA
jgi:hypothetical protein